jgi:Protein of unknown function DUF262/Putative DNA-binding domain
VHFQAKIPIPPHHENKMSELAAQPTPIQTIYSWFREEKLYVNRRYQRKLVWTLIEKQKLIESIMKGYPIPAILLAERKELPGTYEIIDGLQRLHVIVSFIETAFPSVDGAYFDVKQFPTAQNYADEKVFQLPEGINSTITKKETSSFLDYILALSIMRNATDSEVNDVFSRINTYGHRLSDQERRQAGIENNFSKMVRDIACTLRKDESQDILPLHKMPSISIDLAKTQHGYQIQASEVFWVTQGILRSTDLRDSMDEQSIADIAACIIGGTLIERSKDALDEIYKLNSKENERIESSLLTNPNGKNFPAEFKYCIDQILLICESNPPQKLRTIIFGKDTTNAFHSTFAVILIALHELIFKEKKMIVDFGLARKNITNLASRIDTTRRATSSDERRKNINQIKGLLTDCLIEKDPPDIYGNHSMIDIESLIRRSEVELSDYELKQGFLKLDTKRSIDQNMFDKVITTICAIANNGPNRSGKIIIGVADKESDANRVRELDKVEPRKIGNRFIVGVAREANMLKISLEQYTAKWRDSIKSSGLSPHLKTSVLSHIDFHSFYGLGIIIITIVAQKELSYVNDIVYWRNGDSTEQAVTPKMIVDISKRF